MISEVGHNTGWRKIADDVVVMSFPFRFFGIDFARNVTLLRLGDGRVVIHSTAPFEEKDLQAIRTFGETAWLVDATLLHETFAKEGRAALPGLPYLAPNGFKEISGVATQPLDPPPSDWAGEIEMLRLEGTRKSEHVFFHRRSRTLVVADLFFSFPAETQGWARFFARRIMGLPPNLFGVSRFFRMLISDKQAFERSMRRMLEWDFERVVVAHREPLERGAKKAVESAFAPAVAGLRRAREWRIGGQRFEIARQNRLTDRCRELAGQVGCRASNRGGEKRSREPGT